MGTLLITMVLIISGSAVAPWVITWYSSGNCTNLSYITGADDGNHASLGVDGPPPELGWVLLDLGSGNEMPANQLFTVYASSASEENYNVYVVETTDLQYKLYVGNGDDTVDEDFTTPLSPPTGSYRYIYLEATSGVQTIDYAFGPDIDAVGY